MTLNDEVRKVIENHNEEIIDLICSYIEKNEYDIPTIGYTENQDGETLYINGREKLSRKHLYPMDILYALEEEGLIEFEKITTDFVSIFAEEKNEENLYYNR